MADAPTTETPLDPVLTQKSALVHLHNHSEYSSLDGGSKCCDMPAKLDSLGMKAMALTDHGVMQGLPPFYNELKKAGMKPILGMEAYLTEDRFDKSRGTPTWHLTLLAETEEGYDNLCKLSSWAFIDGVIMTFGRPRARADWELLSRYAKGVIAFTGCMASPVMGAIFAGNLTRARENTERLISIFGAENVYGEIQNVGITIGIPGDSEVAQLLGREPLTEEEASRYEEVEAGQVPLSQDDANRVLVEHICKPLGLKYVATGDTHYLNEGDAEPHDAMICIGTSQLKKGPRRFSLLPKRYHMRSEEEMRKAVASWPEAIEETRNVAARCNVDGAFTKRELLPRYPIPEGFKDSGDYLRHLCLEGLNERYEQGTELHQQAIERLEMELGVIASMGFNDYFLITWDLFNEANRRGILSGPGRGSAAGAIVAYCLDITKLCPLEYDLLFERFLNPERRSMPDIDMDFMDSRRKELMEYARDKYNELAGCETSVAQIVTFQKYKAKNALKDASRVLAEPDQASLRNAEAISDESERKKAIAAVLEQGKKDALKLGDKLSALVPGDPGITMGSLWNGKHVAEGEQLRAAHKQGGLMAEVIDQAGWLEGMIKTYGLHAAAVIISSHDMTDDVPLQRFGPDKPLHTQYDMNVCEGRGLLKMDFLGLSNLDIILDACEKIEAVHGVAIQPWKDIPIDDVKTYELFARGDTVGTFQFESSGMRSSLQEVRPTEFTDLIALVALYRPGAMAHIPTYARRKHGREPVAYLDPRLEDIQGETYGITIYQEQSMRIARALAGFSQAEADDLRKAIGKKLRDKMDAIEPRYMEGCKANGVDKEVAKALWADNVAAADYSFNKSHAACYALISYITGWLKANYPHEYMAALLTAAMGDKDKPRIFLTEAKRMGLTVLPPDINRSLNDFAVVEREEEPGQYDILFGLSAIRGVGAGVVAEIRSERERNGFFTSVYDLIRRMPQLNKTVVQALVKGGALDATGASRKSMFDVVEEAQKRIKKERDAEERAFVNAVKARLEAAMTTEQAQAAGHGEQESLGGMDALFAAAVAPTKASGKTKTVKLSTNEKRGVEGGCKQVWAAKLEVSDGAVADATEGALKKEALRLARKEAKEQFADSSNAVAGIAAEEKSDSSAKEQIEELAQRKLSEQALGIKSEAAALCQRMLPHIREEIAEREESAGIDAALAAETDPPLAAEEWDRIEKLNVERNMLGIYVTGHPLDSDADQWRAYVNEGSERGRELGFVTDDDIGQTIIVVGAVVGKQGIRMRSGDVMYRVTLEDLSGSREVTIFPRTLEGGLDQLLTDGQVICMEAGVQEDTFQKQKNEEAADEDGEDEDGERPIKLTASRLYRWDASRITPEFVAKAKARRAAREQAEAEALAARQNGEADTVPATAAEAAATPAPAAPGESAPAEAPAETGPQPVRVSITAVQFNPEWVAKLEAVCAEFPGEHPVKLVLDGKTYKTKFAVAPTAELAAAVKQLLHPPAAPASSEAA